MIYVYLAAPVRPIECETRESNLARARAYYRNLSLAHPDKVFLAPWILNCECFDETPENVEKGMERNKAVIDLIAHLAARCGNWDERNEDWRGQLWLVGPRVSSGMRAEADYAADQGLKIKRIAIDALGAQGFIDAGGTPGAEMDVTIEDGKAHCSKR